MADYVSQIQSFYPSRNSASAFAFFLVLMLIAVIVRAIYQIRDHEAPTQLDE